MVTYTDIRKLVTIDLETATDLEVRILANQILSAARADSLIELPAAIQARLDGTPNDLRAFLKTRLMTPWTMDLRIATVRTLTDAGTNVEAAAQAGLDNGATDVLLTYLNNGLYVARALDACA